jgi:hypothetical protein
MARLFRFFTTIAVLSAGLLTGCASVKMASPNDDAKAKTFATSPNQANLYIYRNEFMGAAIRMAVEIDGKEIGKTGPKSYFAVSVAPGKHTLISRSENDFNLDVVTEAGKNYYVWQEVKMGLLYARTKLQLVDEAQGQAGVKESQLIDTNPDIAKTTSIAVAPVAQTKNSNPPAVASPSTAPSTTIAAISTPVAATSSNELKIEKVPFELGVSSITVERMAKQNSCQSTKGAGLLYKKGPIEVYRVACEDGRELKARCELRQCEFFTP